LAAAKEIYLQLSDSEKSEEAGSMLAAWTDIDEHFVIALDQEEARGLVAGYADSVPLSADVASEIDADLEYYAVSLDAERGSVPVRHTDQGFVLLFTNPSESYLQRISRSITRTFPAGLMSEVGVIVANAAYAGDTIVRHPDLDQDILLTSVFTNSHYHGSVVW